MEERKRKRGMKSLVSYVLAAAMITTSIPAAVFGSVEELPDDYQEEAYVEELSSAAEPDGYESEAEEKEEEEATVETMETDGAEDLLSDGNGDAETTPAIEFEKTTDSGLNVQVSVPENVFPEGTVVDAADVSEDETEALTVQIRGDLDGQLAGEIVKVFAADITFTKDDISLVPGSDVRVTMIPSDDVKAELREKEEKGLALSLVYVPAEGGAAVDADEKIETKTIDGVSFETVQFPRYAIVATANAEEETDGEAEAEVKEEGTGEADVEAKEDSTGEAGAEVEAESTEAAEELTDGVTEETVESASQAEEQVVSAKADGVRSGYYTTFTADLSGASITASVPYYLVSTGTTMEASLVDAADYESIIASANYGKEITDLKAVEIRFADRRGRRTILFSVSLSIQLEDSGAEKYVLYEPYRSWFGTELYQLSTSRSPQFNIYAYSDTYVLAGLKSDGVSRASGVTRRGKTSFALNTGNAGVSASADRSAFIGSVSMEAASVNADAVANAVDSVLPEDLTAESIQAFDISFHDSSNGGEVEPRRDVAVTIALPLNEEAEYRLVHVDDNGEAEIVENAEFSAAGVSFTASDFSIYIVVEVAEDGSLDFEKNFGDSRVSVHAEKGAFEKGTEMVLQSVDPDDLLKIVSALGTHNTYYFNAIDISFYKDGVEVEPVIPVEVVWESTRIEADDEQLIHLKDDGTVEKMTDAVISEGKVEFTATSFSNYTTTRLDTFSLGNKIIFEPESLRNDSSITLPDTMNSGDLSETHPVIDGYTYQKAIYQKSGQNPVEDDPVVYLGAFVYQEFDDNNDPTGEPVTYIYYKTETTSEDSDLIVRLAETDTIHLVYEKTPNKVTYVVNYNGDSYTIGSDALPEELADLVVTGPDSVADNTTYVQGVSVELPRGYSAQVQMSNKSGYEEPSLGEYSEPAYECNNEWTVEPEENTFTTSGLYTISDVTEDLTVTVELKKRTEYQFSATPAFITHYFYNNDYGEGRQNRYTVDGNNPLETTFTSNDHTFVFTTAVVPDGRNWEWVLDSFNINTETIVVPYVNEEVPTASGTTTLTSGTVITLSAQYHAINETRTYTLAISNCYENITITGGNLHGVGDHDEWVVQETAHIEPFEYLGATWTKLTPGEPMTFTYAERGRYYKAGSWPVENERATHYHWDGGYGYRAGYYERYEGPTPYATLTHCQYTGQSYYRENTIRFKVAEGYVNPQIKYVTQTEVDQYDRVAGVTLAQSASTDKYHLVTSEPDEEGYYYFSLEGTETDPGLLSVRAELARYGVSYDIGEGPVLTNVTMPEYDYGGFYGDETLQGYNIIDNQYVVIAKSAPVDTSNEYIFLYYTIEGDTSDDTYAPSQKVELSKIAHFAEYDEGKEEYVIPLVAHWEKKEQSVLIPVIADIYVDDELDDEVVTNIPQTSAIYIDIDSQTMVDIMEANNWQLFYDEVGSQPFIKGVDYQKDDAGNYILEDGEKVPPRVELRLYSKFYVYHSGSDTLELHTTKEAEITEGGKLKIGTLPLYEKYHDDTYLYGGIYSDYNNGAATVKAAADYNNYHETLKSTDIQALSNKEGVTIKTNVGVKYQPDKNTERSWTKAAAYQNTELKPKQAEIYYIKEVPTSYLRPYFHYIYNKNSFVVDDVYVATVIDDYCYNDVGGLVGTYQFSNIRYLGEKFTFMNSEGEHQIHLQTGDPFENTTAGYVGVWKMSGFDGVTVRPYWVTPDGITVKSTVEWTINKNDGTWHSDGSTGGVSYTVNNTPKP